MNNRTCSVEGCDKPHVAKGKCKTHYYQGYVPKSPIECAVEGCGEPARARGWCKMHWQRWRKYGDPATSSFIRNDNETRFWGKVDINGPVPAHRPDLGPCWIWTGQKTDAGYGRFTLGRRQITASRYICELKLGPIPDGHEPDHLCKNTSCVNYLYHLEIVTRQENILRSDGPAAVNARRTHCINGHELSGENLRIETGTGKRRCRACMRERDRRHREKVRTRNSAR